MKQNNRKNTWKAIAAVVLVMTTLFSISTMVSAGFVEEIFEEVCDMMNTSSYVGCNDHEDAYPIRNFVSGKCPNCQGKLYSVLLMCDWCGEVVEPIRHACTIDEY